MFERYTEHARRALFFARYAASQRGGLTIEPEHLVLGVLRDAPGAVMRFTRAGSVRAIEEALAGGPGGGPVSTRVEIPFSGEAKAALERARGEADELQNRWITPLHVIAGVMAATTGEAMRILHEAGVSVDAIREHLRQRPDEPGEHPAPSGYRPGMVVRTWKGVVKPGAADEYVRHLKTETFPALRHLPGHRSASIMRRDVEDGIEFVVTTVWESYEAIRGFAGDDIGAAVVPAAARAMLVRFDDRAVHYQIVL
jgi:ATP-dependent Clp protease ATP-binding subunit ClpA